MSSLADHRLSKDAQDRINQITSDAKAGKVSWKDANAAANDIRASEGAHYTVSDSGETHYGDDTVLGSYASGSKAHGGGNAATDKHDHFKGNQDAVWGKNMHDYTQYAGYDPAKHDRVIQQMGQAAQRGDWDGVGALSHGLIIGSGDGVNTSGDFALGNRVMQDLQKKHNYNEYEYYGGLYDKVYGNGAWADPNHGGPNRGYVDPKYAAAVQQTGSHGMPGGGLGGFNSPALRNPSQFGDFGNRGGAVAPGGSPGGVPGGYGGGPASDYIRQMFQQRENAMLEALRAEYNASLDKLKGVGDGLGDIYDDERNRVAAQADIEKMNLNNMGIAQGLNTGATGELALGQSNAYLGALGQLGRQEAQNRADNERDIAALAQAYNSRVAAAKAQIQAELNDALLNEWRRAEEMAAEEQRRAEADRRWQMQWDAEQEAARRKEALQRAEIMAGLGDMSGYEALGIYAQGQQDQPQDMGAPITNPAQNDDLRGWRNGSLTREQVAQLQRMKPGLVADGLWGKNSSAAFGGMTADQAWEKYGRVQPSAIPNGSGMESLLKPSIIDFLGNPNNSKYDKINAIEAGLKSGEIPNESIARLFMTQMGLT